MKISETNFRYTSDKREIGALLMLLGFCAIIFPSAGIVSEIGPDGAENTDPSEVPLWGLIGGFCLFITGMVSVFTGYLVTVHNWSHPYLTTFLKITIQTAWIPYITDMTNVGRGARRSGTSEGRFLGAIGVLAILAYGFALVGSIAFMVFTLHDFNILKPETHNADYFKGRLTFYSTVLTVAGLLQLILGCYTVATYGTGGAFSEGPIAAAFLITAYPGLTVLVGLIQSINGFWGIARSFGVLLSKEASSPLNVAFPVSLALQWICVLFLQIITQIAYFPADAMGAAAPTIIALSLGLTVMPAYLDHKMRSLPKVFPDNYYSAAASDDASATIDADNKPNMMVGKATMNPNGDVCV